MIITLLAPSIITAQQSNQAGPPPIDERYQAELIDSVSAALARTYIFPDVAEEMSKLLRKNLKDKKYKELTSLPEFTMRLTEDMRSISHDLHLGIRMIPPGYVQEEDENYKEEILREQQFENFGFDKLERLPGNIGYIKFNQFVDASFGGPTAIAAMNFLGHCDALIFDLRENGGGSPSMIQLLSSYLFAEPTHLNSFYVRESDSIQQFWTQEYVPGPKLTDAPVYVLTSDYTFSGAEEFSFNMQNLNRGLIVGDTTGGGAHPVTTYLFQDLNVGIRVPFGRAINPISGTNWEGVGVIPDIAVPTDQALEHAQMLALDTLIKSKTDEQRKFSLQWAYDNFEAELNPMILDPEKLKEYVGDFGPRHIFIEEGSLIYQRDQRPKMSLAPMEEDLFRTPDLDYFRLKFVRNDAGVIIGLVGMYNNGRTDSNPKD
ncbi:MAG: S41 family peptidase [bacterium]|nr:S41 family peptidase [bacterium]